MSLKSKRDTTLPMDFGECRLVAFPKWSMIMLHNQLVVANFQSYRLLRKRTVADAKGSVMKVNY